MTPLGDRAVDGFTSERGPRTERYLAQSYEAAADGSSVAYDDHRLSPVFRGDAVQAHTSAHIQLGPSLAVWHTTSERVVGISVHRIALAQLVKGQAFRRANV